MNTTSERGAEVASYLAQVRAALADLPPQTRDQLIDDVPEHLAEVAAAGNGPLEAQLGPPADFAAELRSAAGLAPRTEAAHQRDAIGDALRAAGHTLATILGYPGGLVEAGRALGPSWWALRGVMVAVISTYMVRPAYGYGEFIYLDLPLRLAFCAFAVVCAVVSLRIGQVVVKGPAGLRMLSAIVSLVVVVMVVYIFSFQNFFAV